MSIKANLTHDHLALHTRKLFYAMISYSKHQWLTILKFSSDDRLSQPLIDSIQFWLSMTMNRSCCRLLICHCTRFFIIWEPSTMIFSQYRIFYFCLFIVSIYIKIFLSGWAYCISLMIQLIWFNFILLLWYFLLKFKFYNRGNWIWVKTSILARLFPS